MVTKRSTQPKQPKEPEPVETDEEFTKVVEKFYAARKKLTAIQTLVNVSIRAGRKLLPRPKAPAQYAESSWLLEVRRMLGPVAQGARTMRRLVDARYRGPARDKRAFIVMADYEKQEELRYEHAVQAEANETAEADNWRRINSLSHAGTKDLPPQSIALLRYAYAMIAEHIKDGKPVDDPIGFLRDTVNYLSTNYEPKKPVPVPPLLAEEVAEHARLISDTRELAAAKLRPRLSGERPYLPAPLPAEDEGEVSLRASRRGVSGN